MRKIGTQKLLYSAQMSQCDSPPFDSISMCSNDLSCNYNIVQSCVPYIVSVCFLHVIGSGWVCLSGEWVMSWGICKYDALGVFKISANSFWPIAIYYIGYIPVYSILWIISCKFNLRVSCWSPIELNKGVLEFRQAGVWVNAQDSKPNALNLATDKHLSECTCSHYNR